MTEVSNTPYIDKSRLPSVSAEPPLKTSLGGHKIPEGSGFTVLSVDVAPATTEEPKAPSKTEAPPKRAAKKPAGARAGDTSTSKGK